MLLEIFDDLFYPAIWGNIAKGFFIGIAFFIITMFLGILMPPGSFADQMARWILDHPFLFGFAVLILSVVANLFLVRFRENSY